MRVLVSLPKEEACLCEMTAALGEPEANVSRHLKILRQAGLLSAQKEGRWVYHRLVPSDQMSLFFKFIRDLPDNDRLYSEDIKRFKTELKKRITSRCVRDAASLTRTIAKGRQ